MTDRSKQTSKHKHIFIYTDVNDTILVKDDMKGESAEFGALRIIAEHLSHSNWQVKDKHGKVTSNYKKYVEYLYPGSPLVDTSKGAAQELERVKHLNDARLIEYRKLLEPETERLLGSKKFKEIHHHFVELQKPGFFPSFKNLVSALIKSKKPFTIIFSSYGRNIKEVYEAMEDFKKYLPNDFKMPYVNFRKIRPGEKERCLQLYKWGAAENAIQDTKPSKRNPKTLRAKPNMEFEANTIKFSEYHKMVQFLKSYPFIYAKVSWVQWFKSNKQHWGAKPFFINNKDISLFFDDNAAKNQIVYAVTPTMDLNNDNRQQITMMNQLITKGVVNAVNTFTAATDHNFFIKKLNRVLPKDEQLPLVHVSNFYQTSLSSLMDMNRLVTEGCMFILFMATMEYFLSLLTTVSDSKGISFSIGAIGLFALSIDINKPSIETQKIHLGTVMEQNAFLDLRI